MKAKIPVFFMFTTVISACVLHLFQFLSQADNTFLPLDNTSISYIIYFLVFFYALSALFYSLKKSELPAVFDFCGRKNGVFSSSVLLSVTFFYDFMHQGYNCYSYWIDTPFKEYTYIIPIGISGLFALASCFYFITVAATAKNENYDFRNFTLMHFAPVAWAFSKLVGIMVKIVDVRLNTEACCEFLLLCAVMCFLFNMILSIDKGEKPASKAFVFSSAVLAGLACIVAVPRMIMLFMGKADLIESVTFSSVNYLMLGVFAFVLFADVNKRANLKN